MSPRSVLSFLKCGAYFLCVFSGLLKSFNIFPIDPTIFFGIPTALILGDSVMRRRHCFTPKVKPAFWYSLAFLIWYLATASYTISAVYWQTKALAILLNIMTFIFPLFCLKDERDFSYFNIWLAVTGLIAIAVILNMYRADAIELLLAKGKARELPDYLMIGTTIGLGVLAFLSKLTPVNIAIALLGTAAMALLGARGPFLLLLLTGAIRLMIHRGKLRITNFRTLTSLAFGALMLFMVLQWEGAGFIRQRIVGGWQESRENALRVPEFTIALLVISENPLAGVGLGGYGLAAYGSDENAYPHDLFLEAFAETGMLGFVIFTLGLWYLFRLAPMAIKTRRGAHFLMLATYMMLNFSKSGGFTSARYLYVFLGLFLSWFNYQTRYDNLPPRTTLVRQNIERQAQS